MDGCTWRERARTLLGAGIDPGQARDAEARQARAVSESTFEKVARDWHGKMLKSWQPRTAKNILHRFEIDLFPVFGSIPIADVDVVDVLKAIRVAEGRGALEMAERFTSDCSRVPSSGAGRLHRLVCHLGSPQRLRRIR